MNKTNRGKSTLPARCLRIDFRRLQQVVAAADYGSFRQAAEALSIKQSTVSHSVKIIEHAFDLVIFRRSTGGVQTTPAGRRFLRTVRSILEQMETLVDAPPAASFSQSGRLTIGFCTSLTAGNLRASLIDYRTRSPRIKLGTVEGSRAQLMTALDNGAIDVFILLGERMSFDHGSLRLWSERIFLVLPGDHALARREVVRWTDLRNERVLLSHYEPETEFEILLYAKLQETSDRPRVERHDVSRGVIKNLVSMGLGISLALESDLDPSFSGLVYRELHDEIGSSRIRFSAAWREDNQNPALASFLKLLADRYRFLPEA